MKEFNKYEEMVIKKHVNPNVCFMTSGSGWEYLNDLQYKRNAHITILGADPSFINQYDKIKDYEIMILETKKEFKQDVFNEFLNIAGIISSEYESKISLVYSFLNQNHGVTACQFVSDSGSIDEIGTVNGLFESRDLLDMAMKNYLMFDKNNTNIKTYK